MSFRNTTDNFDYLNDVLRSDLPDSAKLFFAELIARSAFRSFFGVSRDRWDSEAEAIRSIELLEKAGFITVTRMEGRTCVSHRDFR